MLRLDWRLPESDSNTISMFEAIANWLESDAGPLYQELAIKKGWSNEIICEVDLVLVMTVNPGFGGQSYINSCTSKIRKVREMLDNCGSSADLEVDGGVNVDTVKEVIGAGANAFVAGSAIFNDKSSVAENVSALREKIKNILN